MPTSYNQITGQSLERLAALSDGIFAVAMTLLVLDLHVPASEVIHSQGELWHTLAGSAPQLISYIMSFLTLGIFRNGQGRPTPPAGVYDSISLDQGLTFCYFC
jgi:uncharacterized membrane protein